MIQFQMYRRMGFRRPRPSWPWENQDKVRRILVDAFFVGFFLLMTGWSLQRGEQVRGEEGTNATAVPRRDLNNSRSSSSQRQAQDLSPANNSHTDIRRSRRSMHPLDEHHSLNHKVKHLVVTASSGLVSPLQDGSANVG